MATLDEQIKQSVDSVAADAQTLHDIVHGTNTQTISTDNGNVDSIAKVIKDNKDKLDGSIGSVTEKALEAATSATAAEKSKTDAQTLITDFTNDLAPINQNLSTLNQSVINIDENLKTLNSESEEWRYNTNTFIHPMAYSWKGKVFGENGTVLESQTPLTAGLIAVHGDSINIDYATNTVSCNDVRDNYLSFNMNRDYVNYTNNFRVKWSAKQGAFPAGIVTKAQLSMGQYRGNTGVVNGFVLGLFDDTKTLKLWATTNGSSWTYAGTSGTKQYDETTDYDYDMYHDLTTGRLVISYSEDGKEMNDPTKTWVEDLVITQFNSPIYFNTYSVNAHHYIGNHPTSTAQIAPEKLYMDRFSLTVDDVDLYKQGEICLYKRLERASMYVGKDVDGNIISEMVTNTSYLRKITGDKKEVLAVFGGDNYEYGCYDPVISSYTIKAHNLMEAIGYKHIECRLFKANQSAEYVREMFNDCTKFPGGITVQAKFNLAKFPPYYMSQAHVVENAGTGKTAHIAVGTNHYIYFGIQFGVNGASVLHTGGAYSGANIDNIVGHVR